MGLGPSFLVSGPVDQRRGLAGNLDALDPNFKVGGIVRLSLFESSEPMV